MRCARHIELLGLRRRTYRVLVGTHDERYQLGDPDVVGRIILKWIFRKGDRSMG
jgi:hypothetical protein